MRIPLMFFVLSIVTSAQTFYPVKDAYISQYEPNTNFGAVGHVQLFSNLFSYNNIARSVFEFDLSGIPQGTPVISALFHIYMYNQAGIDFDVDIHRALVPWTETGVNWSNQPVHDTDIVATLPYQGYDWWHFDITNAAQLWINEPATNHGFKMKFRIEQYPDSLGRTAYFYSRDTSFNQPHLDLTLGIEEQRTGPLMIFSLIPNPATGSTRLKLTSPCRSAVRVSLYDIHGRLVRLIDQDLRLTDDSELSFDVHDFPAGVYFLRIHAENYRSVLPLVIIR